MISEERRRCVNFIYNNKLQTSNLITIFPIYSFKLLLIIELIIKKNWFIQLNFLTLYIIFCDFPPK